MADVRASKLPVVLTYTAQYDYFMLLRGDATGATSGPYLLPASAVQASGGSDNGGGGGGGGGSGGVGYGGGPYGGGLTSPVTRVFNRIGEIVAVYGDYAAAQVTYSAAASGLPASNVQEALDALAAGTGENGGVPLGGTEGDVLTRTGAGTSVWAPPPIVSVFGRNDAEILPLTGDYHADQILQVKTVDGTPNTPTTNLFVTAAEKAKLAGLEALPDTTAATAGDVLTLDSEKALSWATPAPGGGGGISQVDLMPLLRPDSSSPPSWVYESGTGTWVFANSGVISLFSEIGYWPGGTVVLDLAVGCAVTSGNIGFSCAVAAITPGSTDLWDKTFAAANSGSVAVADAVKKIKRISITLSNLDSAAAGDLVRLKLTRDNSVGSNAAGNAVLRAAVLRFS